jgi:hypothetical protein
VADDGEAAFEIVEELVARGLSSIDRALPAGVAGECDDCGEQMPRLVNGRCGFCRDGRRPPLSFYENRIPAQPVQPAPIGAPTKETEVKVVNTATAKVVSVPAKGDVLSAIEKIAEKFDLPLGQAAIRLIEQGLERETAVAEAALSSLAGFSVAELLEELGERAERAHDQAALDAAERRAQAAEGKLAALRELIAG